MQPATRHMRVVKNPVKPRHGSWNRYCAGCRCEACAKACKEYGRARRAAKKAGVPFVPPAHLLAPVPAVLRDEQDQVPNEFVYRRFNYTLTVNRGTAKRLAQAFGAHRFIYNSYLEYAQKEYQAGRPHPTAYTASKVLVTQAKKNPDTAWLNLFPHGSLAAAVEDGGIAFKNFFDSVTGRRKGPKAGYPRFKSRHYSEQVAVFPAGTFTINGGWEGTRNRGGKVWVSKIGYLHVNWHRPLAGPPTSMRVKLRRDGKYVVSFVVKAPKHVLTTPTRGNRAAGIDMGLTDYAAIVYSDGTREKIDNPRFRRQAERKVARLQQAVSRKQKGSKNRDKARVKLARAKQREQELRRNHAFQLAKRLVRENQMIAVEDLNVKGLAQGWLAKSVTDTGWGIFLKQLEYLCDINEREFVMVDRFFPSTQLCSQCGERTGKKALHEREFVCPFCGAEVDRDFNAATNIMVAAGRAETLNACGPEIRHVLAAPERAQRGEAGTIQTRKPSAASVRRKSGAGVHADGRIFRSGTTLLTSA